MKTTVVSDTSSLIIFSKLDRFDLLASQFYTVIIPYRVQKETLAKDDKLAAQIKSTPLFEVQRCKTTELLEILDGILDYGEAEAITLAKEQGHILLIDEKKGRSIALGLNIKIIGFLGILLLNNKQGRLTTHGAKNIVTQVKSFQFHLSKKLEKQFLTLLAAQ